MKQYILEETDTSRIVKEKKKGAFLTIYSNQGKI